MKILLATTSQGKLNEMKEIFKNAFNESIELISLNDLPKVKEANEDGKSFLENALIKTLYYYNIFNMPTICDDTGLCIKMLNGRPGIYTARYGSINGEHTDSNKNMNRILEEMKNIQDRSAYFETAMYYYDGANLVSAVGRMNGKIALSKQGENGFGYDPIFYVTKYNCTVACLEEKQKNAISHRGKASKLIISQLYDILS